MRVKKFEAKNMKDALKMVKAELGPDAVILSARDNRKFGLAGETSVEVTAAVSEATLQKKRFAESRLNTRDREKFQTSNARTQRQIIEHMIESRMANNSADQLRAAPRPITTTSYIDIQDEEVEMTPRRSAALSKARGRNVKELLEDFDQDFSEPDEWQQRPARAVAKATMKTTAVPKRPSALAAVTQAAVTQAATAQSVGQSVGQSMGHSRPQAPTRSVGGLEVHASEPQASAEIASLKNEIDRLQKVLETFQKVPQTFTQLHPGADFGIGYDFSFMFQKLTEAGITVDNTVEMLTQAAKEIDPVQAKKRPIVDAWVARYLLGNIQTVSHPWSGRIHLFVGGSGSGKTSSLVKMASHLVVREKKRVAILSTDAFKVGAVDQLKIYCQILNVPFAVVRNRHDWEWVLSQMGNIDHVLVDFPGIQMRDLDEIHLLKSLLPPEGLAPICHFCVSATTKDGDAYEMARRYKVTEFTDLIVTNLDQSVQHGIIYNLQKKTGKPLHSFGIGARIPEDFEPASKERVLDLIFRLTKLRKDNK
jgi:flagellar biosynthesis protein FlhF